MVLLCGEENFTLQIPTILFTSFWYWLGDEFLDEINVRIFYLPTHSANAIHNPPTGESWIGLY